MLFSSVEFLFLYLPLAVVLVRASRMFLGVAAAMAALIVVSLVFYSFHEPWHLAILVGSVAVNAAIARPLHRAAHASGVPDPVQPVSSRARPWLTLGIAFNIALLAWFKYSRFTCKQFMSADAMASPPLEDILPAALPLAISFFTFQQIAYLVDLAKGRCSLAHPLKHLLLVAFFPHLIAGPITQPKVFLPQLDDPRPTWDDAARGLFIFAVGLAKKVCIADQLVPHADLAFSDPATLGASAAWLGTLAYTAVIYFDFSGYSDMAVGLAFLFGLRLPWNFRSPYRATSIGEFWHRWHITLSEFLRDYLYIPLGGSRRTPVRTLINIMITMTLGGLWHGAGWTFVLWGTVHGAAVSLHHFWRSIGRTLPRPVGWFLTMAVVIFAWVLFRSPSLERAVDMYGSLLGRGTPFQPWWNTGSALALTYLGIAMVIALVFPNTRSLQERFRPNLPWLLLGATLMALASARVIAQYRGKEFIYFAF